MLLVSDRLSALATPPIERGRSRPLAWERGTARLSPTEVSLLDSQDRLAARVGHPRKPLLEAVRFPTLFHDAEAHSAQTCASAEAIWTSAGK